MPQVGARIMDLQVPERKMSTTGGTAQGTVYVLDEPEAIVKKFRSAVTDTGTEVRPAADKEGITNLIEVLAAVRGIGDGPDRGRVPGARYGDFKTAVAEAVTEYLGPVQERYAEMREDAVRAGADPRRRRREGPGDRRDELTT